MPSPDVHCLVNSKEVADWIGAIPRVINSTLNRASRKVGGEFGKTFTRARLGPGGIRINRKARRERSKGPRLPATMRAAGFKSEMTGTNAINGKRMRIRTRSRAMYMHEVGGTISSQRPLGMAIPLSGAKKQTWRQEQGTRAVAVRHGTRVFLGVVTNIGGQTGFATVAHFRKSVTMKARLGFINSFTAFAPTATGIIDKQVIDTIQRFKGRYSLKDREDAE
jgi:hypothetical protein